MSSSAVKKRLSHLKDFQRKTVNYVFRRMYLDKNPTLRFLVADEVGLGKTLVASGVIAKTVEHLKGKVGRIDVVYVCSNAAIAQQNINRLNVVEGHVVAASRLTMLPSQVKDLKKHKINFISFTPGTTFYLKSSGGIIAERLVLYHLIKHGLGFNKKGLLKILQVGAGWDNFLRRSKESPHIDSELKHKFITELKKKKHAELLDKLRRMCRRMRKYYGRKNIPAHESKLRNQLIGKLRTVLAHVCVDALEPDLVILDEFQRFKDLLVGISQGDESEAVQLAQALMTFQDVDAHDKSVEDVRVLLLSATPYSMYTLNDEEDDDHYTDFLKTLGFLFNDLKRIDKAEALIRRFREGLYGLDEGAQEDAQKARGSLERLLRSVMVRTERVGITKRQDSMLQDKTLTATLFEEDLIHARHVEKVAQAIQAGDTIEYWKSSPYMLNFMKEYVLKKKIIKEKDNPSRKLLSSLKAMKGSQLTKYKIDHYTEIDSKNGRLRSIMGDTVNKGYWKLLWLPPSLPYIKPEGSYADLEGATKSLVFSAWNVVPDTIAALLSYEAERKMLAGLSELPRYTELYKKRKPLLRFSVSDGVLSGMSTLALLYPCATLAEAIDPLKLSLTLSDDGPASRKLVYHHVREIIIEKLRGAGVTLDHIDGRGDQRWHWASLAILDSHYYPEARRWSWRQDGFYRVVDGSREKGEKGGFSQHVDQFVKDIKPSDLGPMPNDLIDVLVELSLAGPAICAHRGLLRKAPGCSAANFDLLYASSKIADGFRTLFNLPETIGLLREDDEGLPHWRRALQHGIEGNLQAVMDEYIHNLYESLGLSGHEGDLKKIFGELAVEICTALSLRTARIDMDEMGFKDRGRVIDPRRVGMRTRFALRFGEIRDDSGERLARAGVVRQAFNSPFRPFVLASTSIGQEGLDFHPYCHVVYHWNLPSNPVDMEQREGRVHRYKGHAVRKNIALKYGLETIRQHYRGKGDPWDILFKMAVKEREKGSSDLIPYWIFELDDGYKVERRVPIYPLSREESYYKHLKQSLALYRLVFGQPRQEDLLAHIERRMESGEKDLDQWQISLAPPEK